MPEQRSGADIEFEVIAGLPPGHPRRVAWQREHCPSSLKEKPATIAELETVEDSPRRASARRVATERIRQSGATFVTDRSNGAARCALNGVVSARRLGTVALHVTGRRPGFGALSVGDRVAAIPATLAAANPTPSLIPR